MNESNTGAEANSEEPKSTETIESKPLQDRKHDEKKPIRRKQNQMVAEKTSDMYFSGLMSE